MGSFSIAHWLVVVVILLLIFGPKRLSEVGKGLGQGIRNFKKGLDGSEKDAAEGEEEKPQKQLKGSSKKAAPVEDDDDDDEEEAPRPKKTASQKRAEREAD